MIANLGSFVILLNCYFIVQTLAVSFRPAIDQSRPVSVQRHHLAFHSVRPRIASTQLRNQKKYEELDTASRNEEPNLVDDDPEEEELRSWNLLENVPTAFIPAMFQRKLPSHHQIKPFEPQEISNQPEKDGKSAENMKTSSDAMKSAISTLQTEMHRIDAKPNLSKHQRIQRKKRLVSRFNRWLMYQMVQPILEEQIMKSVKSQFTLIQMEIAMYIPEVYEFESVQTSRLYNELPDEVKPFFAQMVKTDRFVKNVAAAIRSGILFSIGKLFTEEAAMPMVRSVARSIVKNIKFPKLKDVFNIQNYIAECLDQLHPVIMKRLDEESLDRILDFYAAQIALFGARGVQAFFVSALRSLQARQWRRQRQLLLASSSLYSSLASSSSPAIKPRATSQMHKPLSEKEFENFFTNQYSFLKSVEFEDYSSDEESDTEEEIPLHTHEHGGFKLPEFKLSPKFIAIAEQFSHSLSVFAAETLQALLTGLMIAYSGLIKNAVRLVLAIPVVRQAILAFFELNVLRSYTVSFSVKRLPTPVCPMNQDVTMDNLWNGERREAERRTAVELHQKMVEMERLAREQAAIVA